MTKFRLICIALLASAISQPALASGWSADSKIAEVRVVATGDLIIKTVAPHGDPDLCGRNREILISKDMPGFETRASLLITAMAGQKGVRFHLNGCTWGTPPDSIPASSGDIIFLD